jgi:signal transduction histidine kinase
VRPVVLGDELRDDSAVQRLKLAHVVIATAGLVLGIVAYEVQVDNLPRPGESARAITIVAAGWAFVLAGLVAWARRRGNRVGPLMVVAGFALLLRQLRYSHDAGLFTLFFLLGDLGYALIGHAALAYPSGRVVDRAEKAVVAAGYVAVLAFPLAVLLFYNGKGGLLQFDPFPRRNLLLISSQPHLVEVLQRAFIIVFYGVLATLFIALIARRLIRATKRARRMLAPLLLCAVVAALRAVFESVFTFVDRPFASEYLFWWQIAGVLALPLALLVGLLRSRLAHALVGELIVRLERTPPQGLRDELARALADPSLELAFWLPERREFVSSAGRRIELPPDRLNRSVTRLEHEGEPIAALVHDPSLLDEPELVEEVSAAARLALENARLHAELRAQLAKVEASRERLVTAADEERRRIERDLHDGAQQQLVALALQLRRAQARLGQDTGPEIERLLGFATDELQLAVQGLRELAHGIRPPILTQGGLAAALDALATRAPLPVSVDAMPERLPPEIEATAYFVACEGLANVVKHAGASRATISARHESGKLFIEVVDDGIGGADPSDGSGLRGLADRVEAHGGRLRVESAVGKGSRVVGEIPCAS